MNTDTAEGRAISILTNQSVANKLCGELLANYSDELLQAIFALRGYIFEPIQNWLDLYEKGET